MLLGVSEDHREAHGSDLDDDTDGVASLMILFSLYLTFGELKSLSSLLLSLGDGVLDSGTSSSRTSMLPGTREFSTSLTILLSTKSIKLPGFPFMHQIAFFFRRSCFFAFFSFFFSLWCFFFSFFNSAHFPDMSRTKSLASSFCLASKSLDFFGFSAGEGLRCLFFGFGGHQFF